MAQSRLLHITKTFWNTQKTMKLTNATRTSWSTQACLYSLDEKLVIFGCLHTPDQTKRKVKANDNRKHQQNSVILCKFLWRRGWLRQTGCYGCYCLPVVFNFCCYFPFQHVVFCCLLFSFGLLIFQFKLCSLLNSKVCLNWNFPLHLNLVM